MENNDQLKEPKTPKPSLRNTIGYQADEIISLKTSSGYNKTIALSMFELFLCKPITGVWESTMKNRDEQGRCVITGLTDNEFKLLRLSSKVQFGINRAYLPVLTFIRDDHNVQVALTPKHLFGLAKTAIVNPGLGNKMDVSKVVLQHLQSMPKNILSFIGIIDSLRESKDNKKDLLYFNEERQITLNGEPCTLRYALHSDIETSTVSITDEAGIPIVVFNWPMGVPHLLVPEVFGTVKPEE